MAKERSVPVGNGMAGMRTIEELLKLEPEMYDITVFGSEPHPNYNPILLSPVLSGEKTIDEIVLNPREWYADNGVTLHTGDPVVGIDRVKRQVVTQSGRTTDYDRLLLATGSNPFLIPVPGHDLPGVMGYRDIADVDAMLEAANQYRKAVVIGGGLLGLEAAYGLQQQGMDVTVVHLLDALMERHPGAGIYKKLVIRNNKLDGAVLYGDTVDGAWFFQLMRSGTDISDLRENLLFGETHLGDAGHGGHTQAANMNDEMQVYRVEARYLERTAPWVARVGLSYIKSRLLNDEVGRKALHKRFLESEEVAQIDPWKQRAEGAEAHEFTALGQVG